VPTSGTTDFTLDFTEIAEEAWERAGKEMRSGYQLRTARRSMNLLCIEWQNRGMNLWTVEEGTIPLLTGVSNYTLPADTLGLIEQQIRTDDGNAAKQTDLSITRIGVHVYASIPNKLTQGRPIQVYVDRQRDATEINIWPVPNSDIYTFAYWRMRRLQDAGSGAANPDMPYRFLPALVAGLAYYIAMKDPELRAGAPMLQAEYEKQYDLAAQEDREKVPFRAVPRLRV